MSSNSNENCDQKNGTSASTKPKSLFSDLKMDQLIRGTTPKEINSRCLSLCQDYIGGSWRMATKPDDIDVKRISGGLTNQLYHVTLKPHVKRCHNELYPGELEPTEVAIKLYQSKHLKNFYDEYERLNDTIILTIVSELNIAPKVYGIFNDGFIQGFYKHEQFRPKHQKNDVLLRKLAHILARINLMNVPVIKRGNWLLDQMQESMENGCKLHDVEKLAVEYDLKELQQCDLLKEFGKFRKAIDSFVTPMVFCHNDFRGSNILVLTDSKDAVNGEQSIVMCDFEYCSYGPRGYDIAVFLSEWGQELFETIDMTMIEDSVIEHFVRFYLEGCDLLKPGYSSKAENSVQNLMNETKVFMLVNYMFYLTFTLNQSEKILDLIPFDTKFKLTNVNNCLKKYTSIKQHLIDRNIIQID